MPAPAEFAHDDPEGHRHAVDLRRERFGDKGEFHGAGCAAEDFLRPIKTRPCRSGMTV
jgi:hypothetical protein